MNILHVNTTNSGGGAARIMASMCAGLKTRGHDASELIGWGENTGDCTSKMGGSLSEYDRLVALVWGQIEKRIPGAWKMRSKVRVVTHPVRTALNELGVEDFCYPASRQLLKLAPWRPDLVNLHNLHGGYFDLRALSDLSRRVPTVLTLHDAWLLSGHCAHSVSCDRWLTGCGHCPALGIYVPIKRDASSFNWRRKERIYKKSSLAVVTPCKWLMGKVERSMLAPAVKMSEVIHNGVDVKTFKPGNRLAVRDELGLAENEFVMLAISPGGKSNPWKNSKLILEAVEVVAKRGRAKNPVLLLVGGDIRREQIGGLRVESVGYQSSMLALVKYYQAADVYIHAAKADTFPTTILESMACGIPVVAVAVDGIPEQVQDGVTGILITPGSVNDLAETIESFSVNPARRREMGVAAERDVSARFTDEIMCSKYLVFYENWKERHRVLRQTG